VDNRKGIKIAYMVVVVAIGLFYQRPGQPISIIRKIEPGESSLPAFAISAARR